MAGSALTTTSKAANPPRAAPLNRSSALLSPAPKLDCATMTQVTRDVDSPGQSNAWMSSPQIEAASALLSANRIVSVLDNEHAAVNRRHSATGSRDGCDDAKGAEATVGTPRNAIAAGIWKRARSIS